MDTQKHCQSCQAPLAADAPRGLCPACLMKVAMATGTVAGQERPGFTPPSTEELAHKFPQLEIIELIGRGGMGAVYKARQKELDRIVALKILPPGIGDDASFAERFAREAKALARLNHPGIITIHDFGRADGLYFFVMEFVDGVNLRQLLASSRVSPREALAIVPQICDALQFAHDQGIVHRDIKPENILLDRRGRVKVADFGLAKIIEGRAGSPLPADSGIGTSDGAHGVTHPTTELTAAGKIMGTPAYMAPEQVEHPAEVDHRADIYALGVVFYQMLTGELPGKRIEAPSKKVQIDVRLDEVVLRALEKQPELRYQHVSDVKTMLETIAGTAEVPAAEPGVGQGLRIEGALTKEEAEELGRDISHLFTRQGLISFARRSLFWFANQALLLFDLFATVPAFAEHAKRRRFNFWPLVLLFCSNLGFIVNGVILAISLVQRLWHAGSPALSAQERVILQWLVLFAVGRLAALNMGSSDATRAGNPDTANRIPLRRVVRVLRTLLGMAALVFGTSLASNWLITSPPAALNNIINRAPALATIIGFAVLVIVACSLFWIFFRVWREIKEMTEENANSDGLPAVEAWLAIIDGGDYAQSWETAAAYFQRHISKEEWVRQMQHARRPLGKVRSRKSIAPKFKAGWMSFGAKFSFSTSLDGLPAATETATFARQQPNCEWKAIGYLIEPAEDRQEESEPRDQQVSAVRTMAGSHHAGTVQDERAQPKNGGREAEGERRKDALDVPSAVKSSRRSWSLIVVAVLFILIGCVAAWDIGSNLHNRIYSVNFSLLCLSVGVGILRLRPRWRVAALIMIWLPFILGACLGIAALFGQFTIRSHATFFGFELTGVLRFIATIAACTLIPILLVWMSRVLTRSDVKALFQQASPDRPWLEWAALPAAIMMAFVLANLVGASGSVQSSTANPLPAGSSAATFGPVIERVIPDPAEGTACVLDFETGNLLEPPAEVVRALSHDVSTFDPTILRWLRDNGGDAAVAPDGSIQLMEGVVLNPTVERHATTWEELTPNVVASGIDGMSEEERRASIHQPAFHLVTLRYPAAMEFTTRERSVGVLQILGATDNPHGVKIRYRLVQDSKANVAPSTSPAPAAEQPEATLGPAFGGEQEFRKLLAESVPVK